MAPAADTQRFLVRGRSYAADDEALQQALAAAYDAGERPRCLCRGDGVEMYVALHSRYLVKRMPDSGSLHHPGCPSYAPEAGQSGLGELMGEAVLEPQPGQVELRVDFPWTHLASGGGARKQADREPSPEVQAPRRRMSLRAVTHFLIERAGLNRWVPAMAGKRQQAVIHRYLTDAAVDVSVKGERLAQRLYVPEAFHRARYPEIVRRRREKLAVLHGAADRLPLALLIGELKAAEARGAAVRVWIKHVPDVPLWADARLWGRLERANAALFEARGADLGARPRLLLTALIRARREHTYEIDTASVMLASPEWIPVEGVHELPLVEALVGQQRRFYKPLRYDARAGGFPAALLLDTGAAPTPLYVASQFAPEREQAAVRRAADGHWLWATAAGMPDLPPPVRP